MIRFEDASLRHAPLIVRSMRERDYEEIRSGWGMSPYQATRLALKASYYARVLWCDLEPLAMYGLAPLSVLGGVSQVWIFGTRFIDAHPVLFARASRRALVELHRHARLLTNRIDMGDAPALRWLKWLGGTCGLRPEACGDRVFSQFFLGAQCRPR